MDLHKIDWAAVVPSDRLERLEFEFRQVFGEWAVLFDCQEQGDPNIITVTFMNREAVDDIVYLLPKQDFFAEFYVHNSGLSDQGLSQFFDCDRRSCTTIELHRCSVTGEGISAIGPQSKLLEFATDVNSSRHAMISSLKNHESLQCVRLTCQSLSENDLAPLSQVSRLRELNLTFPKTVQHLEFLANCERLASLEIKSPSIGGTSCNDISRSNSLHTLLLEAPSVDVTQVQQLRNMQSLKSLTLFVEDCPSIDVAFRGGCLAPLEDVAVICNSIGGSILHDWAQIQTLSSIYLESRCFDAVHLAALKHSRVESLTIKTGLVTPLTALDNLRDMPNLKSLTVSSPNVDDIADELMSNLPSVCVFVG